MDIQVQSYCIHTRSHVLKCFKNASEKRSRNRNVVRAVYFVAFISITSDTMAGMEVKEMTFPDDGQDSQDGQRIGKVGI